MNASIIELKVQLLQALNLCKLSKYYQIDILEDECGILFGYMMINSNLEIDQQLAKQIIV